MSEVIGTVLLLGISVIMVGSVAVWTSQIDTVEDTIFVDLWATVNYDQVEITHRGGDLLEGRDTTITLYNSDGSMAAQYKYYDPAEGRTDEQWGTGEELILTLGAVTDEFKLLVTSIYDDGTSFIVLRNIMNRGVSTSGKADLAITRLSIQETDGTDVTTLFEKGEYLIRIDVTNFGAGISTPYLTDNGDNTVKNLVIYDNQEHLVFTGLSLVHFEGGTDNVIPETDLDWGELANGDYMAVVFTWDPPEGQERTLGLHDLAVKVIGHPSGEMDYRNNIVKRKFIVDKEISPIIIPGPDPGIYDIYFSNEVPRSGEEVIVTVIVQNSGSEPMEVGDNVNLIVSLWAPAPRIIDSVSYWDWKVDNPGHYENWRMDDDGFDLEDDDEFPTCVLTDLVLLPGSYLFFYFTLEARVEIPGDEQWVYATVDPFNNSADPEGLGRFDGDDPQDNRRMASLQVLPRILLVDDDTEVSGSENDMTSIVLESMIGAGVEVDTIFTAQSVDDTGGPRDAPAFTYKKAEIPYPAMEDYDIVIWVTGYDPDPLTNDPRLVSTDFGGNLQEIMDYLDNNGYFLIVGTDPFTGLLNYLDDGYTYTPSPAWTGTPEFSDVHKFLFQYLGISRIVANYDLPYQEGSEYLLGVDDQDGSITPPPDGGGDYQLALSDLAVNNQLSSMFIPRDTILDKDGSPYFDVPVGTMTTQAIFDASEPWVNGVRSWSIPEVTTGVQYRAVSLGWDIEQIKYLNQEIDLMANILKFFDWEIKVGRDLAVTKMEMFILSEEEDGTWNRLPITEDNFPKYLDTIEIEVSIRNNGPNDESSTVTFYVTGPNGIEVPVTPYIPDPRPIEQRTDPLKTSDANPLDILDIDGGGGEVTRYKLWLALGSGLYNFRVMVDPFHLISEINEYNNDISYSTSTLASLIAQNNILIIDDDGSLDNFRDVDQAAAQDAELVIEYLEGEPSAILGSVIGDLDYDYEVFNTETYFDTEWVVGNGPGIVDLKRFNSVIWVTADSGNIAPLVRETITDTDMLNIMKYLNGLYDEAEFLDTTHDENIMFVGGRILPDLAPYDHVVTEGSLSITTGQFLREYLGVVPQEPMPAGQQGRNIYGARSGSFFEDTYFGIEYRSTELETGLPFDFLPLTLSSETDLDTRTALFSYGLSPIPRSIAVQQQKHTISPPNYFRTLYHAWELTSLEHTVMAGDMELALHEMMFLSLNWFDTPEDQPELVSRNMLLEISSDHPALGNSYIVTAKVANMGGYSGGGTVRFMDGNTLFKSQYIFLDPGDEITLEAIWDPLYAGTREIRVWFDRWDDYDEVFDSFNNEPFRRTEVFFLWDDMESDPGNWEHDSLVAMINGENPLDYFDPLDPDPQTNIISNWDESSSSGMVETGEEFRSSPYSFYLKESEGVVGNEDVIISFVIDDSASMEARTSSTGDTWLEVAKDAALILLDQLSDDSVVVSIWDFKGNSERRWAGPTDRGTSEGGISTTIRRDPIRVGDDFSGVSGRQRIRNEIEDMDNPSGTTILWDAVGEAYLDVQYWNTYFPDLTPAVVVLSDGMDIQASDRSGLSILTVDNTVEGGSTFWAPWDDMANGEQYYQYHQGKYTLDWSGPSTSTYWMYAMAQGSMTHDRTGLLYADIPIYTVGLGVEHYDPPYEPVENDWPVGSVGDHIIDYAHAMCDDTDDGCQESGTLEYNLWRIADTSDAKYFYAPTADELEEVFKKIGQLLANPEQQSRSSAPTRQEGEPNSNKWAVTPEFDLSGSNEATLTFWHRYNMVDGANGGYVLIGYMDPLVDTDGNGDPTDDFDWNYATPLKGFYTGSMMPGVERDDSFGHDIVWGWNGMSSEGIFGWDFVEFDILDRVPMVYRDRVKIRFQYTQYGCGTGDGWWIDDVKVVTSRAEAAPITSGEIDTWQLITGSRAAGTTHSGTHSWFCSGVAGGDLVDGIDNSLYTRAIDLTNARYAYLEFYTRFNIQYEAGRPPDGFRVEVSKNGGLSWAPLNYGVRTSWRVSGTEADADDGIDGDGRSYTGITDPGDSHNWVPGSSITRLSTNLNGFTGEVIILRFRVVTNIDGQHYEDPDEFMGVYIDDIMVYGESQESTRSTETEELSADIEDEPAGIQEKVPEGPEAEFHEGGTETIEGSMFTNGKIFGLLLLSLLTVILLLSAARKGVLGGK